MKLPPGEDLEVPVGHVAGEDGEGVLLALAVAQLPSVSLPAAGVACQPAELVGCSDMVAWLEESRVFSTGPSVSTWPPAAVRRRRVARLP